MNNCRKTLLAFLIMVSVTACGSPEESSARYIESGKALVASGELEKAKLEFRNALQINPLEAEGYYQLALLDEKEQKWRGMYDNLVAVESLEPEHVGAIVKLGQIELLSGQLDKALERAEKALTLEPENITAILLLATVKIKQENFAEAEKQILSALAIDSNNMDALSARIMLYKEQQQLDRAMIAVDEAMLVHPDAMPIKMIKLEILNARQDFPAMEILYREIVEDFPNESWPAVALARLLNGGMNRFDDAIEVLQQFIDKNPEDTDIKLSLISLMGSKDMSAALNKLDAFIEDQPENENLRFAKIELLQQSGDQPAVMKALEELVQTQPESPTGLRAKATLASYQASEGNFEQAEKMADEVLELAPDNEEALILKSKIQLTRSEFDSAITNLRNVIRNNPDSDEALVLISQAYIRTGSEQLAQSSLRRALTINPQNPEAALSIAGDAVRANEYERAESTLTTALQGNETNVDLLQALAQVRLIRQDWSGSSQAIENLSASNPESAANHLLKAQMHQGLNEHALAIEQYKIALTLQPELMAALQGISGSYEALGQQEALVAYLEQYIAENPVNVNGYAALSNHFAREQTFERAAEVANEGLEQNPEWLGGYSLLAEIYNVQGNRTATIAALRRAVAVAPENNMLTMQLASSLEQSGIYQEAKDLYEGVLARDPSQDIAANNLANLLADEFETPENLERALTISSRFKDSDQPYFVDTYGWVNYKMGNYEEARPALEKGAQIGAEVAIFHYHLAVLYTALEMSDQAANSLQTAERLATQQNDSALLQKIRQLK